MERSIARAEHEKLIEQHTQLDRLFTKAQYIHGQASLLDLIAVRKNLFSLIECEGDCHIVGKLIFPIIKDVSDPFWVNMHRDIFVSVLRICHANNQRSNSQLDDILEMDKDEAIEKLSGFWVNKRLPKFLAEAKMAYSLGSAICI